MSDDDSPGRLFVVTGIRGSGTSSVGRALAEALPRAVFIDGQTVGETVVSGAEPMSDPPRMAAIEQLLLRYAGSLTLADVYRTGGFDAVIADSIVGRYLEDFLELADPDPVHLVVLHPTADAVIERDSQRRGSAYRSPHAVQQAWTGLEHDTERLGLWIDNSTHTPAKTVTQILRSLDAAFIEPV